MDYELIPLVDCLKIPREVEEYLLDSHDYGCHYDHTVIQLEDDGNVFAEWLKSKGYQFKSTTETRPGFDFIAVYGT